MITLEDVERLERETILNPWKNAINPRSVAVISWMIVIGVVLGLFLSGCSTAPIVPKPVHRAVIDFSGNYTDGGVLSVVAGKGVLVRQNIVDRYDALVQIYGPEFIPPTQVRQGVIAAEGGLYWIDLEHYHKFLTMIRWKRMGRLPSKSLA